MSEKQDVLKTGTTTIGVRYKDGVIIASDQRATMSTMIAHSDVQKVYKIADNLGMTIAGVVGDAQLMIRYVQSEVALYSMRKGGEMSVNAAATLVANIIRNGFYVGHIIGGFDKTGAHLFSIDAAGGYIEDNIMSVGSGSVFALGALEAGYKKDMKFEEARDLVITALHSALSRDSASGDGMLIAVIDKNGFNWIPQDEIKDLTSKLGYNYPVR